MHLGSQTTEASLDGSCVALAMRRCASGQGCLPVFSPVKRLSLWLGNGALRISDYLCRGWEGGTLILGRYAIFRHIFIQ